MATITSEVDNGGDDVIGPSWIRIEQWFTAEYTGCQSMEDVKKALQTLVFFLNDLSTTDYASMRMIHHLRADVNLLNKQLSPVIAFAESALKSEATQ